MSFDKFVALRDRLDAADTRISEKIKAQQDDLIQNRVGLSFNCVTIEETVIWWGKLDGKWQFHTNEGLALLSAPRHVRRGFWLWCCRIDIYAVAAAAYEQVLKECEI